MYRTIVAVHTNNITYIFTSIYNMRMNDKKCVKCYLNFKYSRY